MLSLLVAPLLSLSPQEPVAPPVTPATTAQQPETHGAPAGWLPDDTLLALTVAAPTDDPDITALLDSDDARTLHTVFANLLTDRLPTTDTRVSAAALTEALTTSLHRGLALGLVGFDRDGTPDVVLVADLGEATDTLAARFAELPQLDGGLHVIADGNGQLVITANDGLLAMGTRAATVRAAVERALRGGRALADEQDFARSLPAGDNAQLAHLFVRPRRFVEALVGVMPETPADAVRRVASVLGVDGMTWGGVSLQLAGDDLVTRYQLAAPQGFSLLDALAGTSGRIDPNLARFVPTGTRGYSFHAIAFGNVFDEAMAIVNAVDTKYADVVDQLTAGLRQRAGADLRADLVGGLGDRLLTFTLPDETVGSSAFGGMIELRDGKGFERILGKMLPLLPTPMTAGTTAGARCWRGPTIGEGVAPAVAVVGDWLIFASNDATLGRIVRHTQAPKAAPEVLTFLRSLPTNVVWAAQGPAIDLPGQWFDGVRDELAQLGSRRTVLQRTAELFSAEERASARDLLRAGALVARSMGDRFTSTTHDGLGKGTRTTDGDGAHSTDPEAVERLQKAEVGGPTANGKVALASLLTHDDATIVARATWLLGQWKATESVGMLAALAATHVDAEVRLQAIGALSHMATKDIAPQLVDATEDSDRRVRTLALQTLSRLGPTLATDAVLAVLDKYGSEATTEVPSDLIVALVTLHDLGDPQQLLPAASAIGFEQGQVGQALAFLFQGLSPRLQPKDEVATLLAVLDHPESTLRRYAVQRLGELRDPTTIAALEGRLASEGSDLQPLVRVSLAQVRGDVEPPADDLVARAKSNVAAISQMVERRWNALDGSMQVAVMAIGGLLLFGLVAVWIAHRHKKQRAAATAATALVGPSAGYAGSDQGWGDGFDAEYVDDGATVEGEYDEYEQEEVGAVDGVEPEERY